MAHRISPCPAFHLAGHVTYNSGKTASNVKLSRLRAEPVGAWFVAEGIPADRVTALGYGPANPVVPNVTPEGNAKNRRIALFRTK